MKNENQVPPVPAAILAAAVGLLQPYAPNLTTDALSEALATCTSTAKTPLIEKPFSLREAASVLGVSRATLARWRSAGKLHDVHITSKCVRIPAADVRALLEA